MQFFNTSLGTGNANKKHRGIFYFNECMLCEDLSGQEISVCRWVLHSQVAPMTAWHRMVDTVVLSSTASESELNAADQRAQGSVFTLRIMIEAIIPVFIFKT